MSEFAVATVLVILYRVVVVLAGVCSVYFGYKLFRVGVYEKAGELKAAWGDKRLILKQAAPGTFFALFGAAIVIAGLWRGVAFEQSTRSKDNDGSSSKPVVSVIGPSPIAALAIGKILKGEALTDEERKGLSNWFNGVEQNISIHAARESLMPMNMVYSIRDEPLG